jgi:hypothetical protein
MAHFMPTKIHVIAKGTARLFYDHVYKLHGLSKVTISDKEIRFTNIFWNVLHGHLGTRLVVSTTFHPQNRADGIGKLCH